MKRLLLAVAAAVALGTAGPAHAAGVGGVEVTPPSGTSFRVDVVPGDQARQEFLLRNVLDTPATVRLYGASAERGADGTAWTVAGPGSAEWLGLEAQEVTLRGGESRTMAFAVEGDERARTGAVVVETGTGTVVQRAATLVHVGPAPRVPLPLLLVVAAVVLLLVSGAGVAVVARRRADG